MKRTTSRYQWGSCSGISGEVVLFISEQVVHEQLAEWVITHCRYRVAKIHRMPHLYRSFSAKEPYNYWLLCEK